MCVNKDGLHHQARLLAPDDVLSVQTDADDVAPHEPGVLLLADVLLGPHNVARLHVTSHQRGFGRSKHTSNS